MQNQLIAADEAEPPDLGYAAALVHPSPVRHPPLHTFVHRHGALKKAHGSFPISTTTRNFIENHYPSVSDEEWNSWKWQIRNGVRHPEALSRFLRLSAEESLAMGRRDARPVALTPYYLSLCDPDVPGQAIRRTVVPVSGEYVTAGCEAVDPLSEERHSPVPGLVHRYPDRVLFLVTSFCSTLCRYCTRSRMVIRKNAKAFLVEQWQRAIEYIERHAQVRDVLLSGGDPLTMGDAKIEWLLSRLRRIPHVEIIRIGTKTPAVLPQRITPKLVGMLKKYHPLWMSLHFTHPDEMTPESREACARLADAGIPLGSQTVLLAGINDSVETMKALMHALMRSRVRPYYIYQCDPVQGTGHFRTPVRAGLEIIQGMRGHTSGYAVPSFVIDAPDGGGKIPLLPEYAQGYDGKDLILRNYEGKLFRYPDEARREAVVQ